MNQKRNTIEKRNEHKKRSPNQKAKKRNQKFKSIKPTKLTENMLYKIAKSKKENHTNGNWLVNGCLKISINVKSSTACKKINQM